MILPNIHFNLARICILVVLLGVIFAPRSIAQEDQRPKQLAPIKRIEGQLILDGSQNVSEATQKLFVKLTGNSHCKLAMFVSDKTKIDTSTWEKNIPRFKLIRLAANQTELPRVDHEWVMDSSCYWVASDVATELVNTGVIKRLREAASNGITIGGNGAGAECIGTMLDSKKGIKRGLDLLPNSIVWSETVSHTETSLEDVLKKHPDRLGWSLPEGSVAIVHEGQRIGVLGGTPFTLQTAGTDDWPAHKQEVTQPIRPLPYSTDLLAWNRSAQARVGKTFPPTQPVVPNLKNGQLMMIGGGGSTDDMWKRFIRAAGGKSASIVCVEQKDSSSIAELLREMGCSNVKVLFGYDLEELRQRADTPGEFLTTLQNADAIFLGGGRTFRFMEAYRGTKAHEAMRQLLNQGGVIGGTSAGAQIQGDFLVRGDPKTNQTLWMPGNDRGFSFIEGVIIDAHFRQRGRHETFPKLVKTFPQMLGIGIDEKTALWITGSTAEVMGANQVTFYDYRVDSDSKIHVLKKNQEFDLKSRTPVK